MLGLFQKKCPICKMAEKKGSGTMRQGKWFCSKEHEQQWEKLPSCCK